MNNRTSLLLAGIAVVLILSGCSSQATGNSSSPTASPNSAGPAGSSTPLAPDPVESEPAIEPDATPTNAGPVECNGTNLGISIAAQPMASGAGQFYSEITFTNITTAACFVEGPPSIFNLADSATGEIVGMRSEDSGISEVVQLAPGASATAPSISPTLERSGVTPQSPTWPRSVHLTGTHRRP
jgi:hypothetical protein